MPVNAMALVLLIGAGLCALVALRILWGQGIGRFIIMLVGLGLLSIGVGGIVGGLDLLTYHKPGTGQEIASVKFEKIGPQQFRVTVVDGAGESYLRQIDGAQWQLSARVIETGDLVPAQTGIGPLYRLDKLSGLSTGIRGDQLAGADFPLYSDRGIVDLWLWLTRIPRQRLLRASYASTGYAPMLDNQVYVVRLDENGLVAAKLE